MEIESDQDDWNPIPDGQILNKKIVNFTNAQIKQNLKDFDDQEQQFIDDIPKFKEDLDYEKIDQDIQDKLFQENLYDPQLDYKDEDWVKQNKSIKLIFYIITYKVLINNQTVFQAALAVLLKYALIVKGINNMKRHDTFKNQYRAMFATNVKLDVTKTLKIPQNNLDDRPELFFSVLCSECLQQVAVYEFESKIFHFFNIIAGVS